MLNPILKAFSYHVKSYPYHSILVYVEYPLILLTLHLENYQTDDPLVFPNFNSIFTDLNFSQLIGMRDFSKV